MFPTPPFVTISIGSMIEADKHLYKRIEFEYTVLVVSWEKERKKERKSLSPT
jgi:hypothetical protein